jgi:hypothetical protein
VSIPFIIILIDNFILICFLFKEFLGDDQGNITGIRTVKVDWVKVGIIITLLPGVALQIFLILLVEGYSAILLFVESGLDGRFESSSISLHDSYLILILFNWDDI